MKKMMPPRLGLRLLVRWGKGVARSMSLAEALRESRNRTEVCELEGSGVYGEIEAGGKNWVLVRGDS